MNLEGAAVREDSSVQDACPQLSTHLDGSFPHDLPQLGDVVVLLDGCPQVAIILGLGGGGLPAEGALREETAAQELPGVAATGTKMSRRGRVSRGCAQGCSRGR